MDVLPTAEPMDEDSRVVALSHPSASIAGELEWLLPSVDLAPYCTMTLDCSVRTAISPSSAGGLRCCHRLPLFKDVGELELATGGLLRILGCEVTSLSSHVEGMNPMDLDDPRLLECQDSTDCQTHSILDLESVEAQ